MKTLFLYIALITGFFANDNPKLTINITNIESIKGKVVIGVYSSGKNFLKDGAEVKNYTFKVDGKSKQIVITDLPKGDYAISMYHDENSDDECNLNFLGIPKEGYGFSNNIKPKFSAPTYEDCKFSLVKDEFLTIKLIN
ncbi:DUF2141 domain-containing protein [Gelidibacter mesophilus]|uniref:DUF2141 domain-containing protein n=1 Tax=Gelidibacter mesophilus TaxID=169050 RepID=UPI00041F48F3|nr:DUF2141 domain-containing protein [Gelidibacter mesophilus]